MATSEKKIPTEYSRCILIPVDPSNHCRRAFDYYVSNIWRAGDAIVFCHILEPSFDTVKTPSDLTKDFRPVTQQRIVDAQQLCESFLDAAREGPVELHRASILIDSKPGQALVKACNEYKIDMIIMGNRGVGKMRRVFLGSVSDYVLQHCQRPVLIVPPEFVPDTEGEN